MLIAFACHECGHEFAVEEWRRGQHAPCPNCGADLIVPARSQEAAHRSAKAKGLDRLLPPEAPPPQEAKVEFEEAPRPRMRMRAFPLKELFVALAAFAAFVGLAATLWRPGVSAALGHYLCLALLTAINARHAWGGGVGHAVARLAIVSTVWLAAWCWWLSLDHAIDTWKSTDEPYTSYVDYQNRWTGRVFYRETHNEIRGLSVYGEGGMARDAVPHGEWNMRAYAFDPDKEVVAESLGLKPSGFGGYSRRQWFWYGEEVTEGEWERYRRL